MCQAITTAVLDLGVLGQQVVFKKIKPKKLA